MTAHKKRKPPSKKKQQEVKIRVEAMRAKFAESDRYHSERRAKLNWTPETLKFWDEFSEQLSERWLAKLEEEWLHS